MLEQFDEEARRRVNVSVAEAEAKTAAEIVPVVASRSGAYDRAEDIVGLWTALAVTGFVWLVGQGIAEADWTGELEVRIGFGWIAALLVGGFVGGVFLADRVPPLCRLFVPARELERRTVARAKEVFFDRRIHRTVRATGLLIYISLFERRVVVLADDAVAEKLSERALGEVRDEVAARLREGDLSGGLAAGVARVGSLLAEVLPPGETPADEVPNEVVVLGR